MWLFKEIASLLGAFAPLLSKLETAYTAIDHQPITEYRNPLKQWIDSQTEYSISRILANTAPFASDPSAMAGAVCASPSRHNPDYYYTWTRDSGLVMNEILNWVPRANRTFRARLDGILQDYVAFSRHVQLQPGNEFGLGAAKFHMDGSVFSGNWCNPQSDGPAIRAIALVRYAHTLLDRGLSMDHLYSANKASVIGRDLEYVVRVWGENTNCEIWEEARGSHFYTLMVQRRALIEGAKLAHRLGDLQIALRYEENASGIELMIDRFWDPSRGHLLATVEWSGGLSYKYSNLDSQVFLASLHANLPSFDDEFYDVAAPRMVATVLAIVRRFKDLYAINEVGDTEIGGRSIPIGPAVGRYPEDRYNGVGTGLGNPWSLITSGLAEYHYRLAVWYMKQDAFVMTDELVELLGVAGRSLRRGDLVRSGSIEQYDVARYLVDVGDLYMARVARHTAHDHTMYEQWYRGNGFGQGAVHLTWSYAAHTAAAQARENSLALIAG